ncbi:MAG: hypothetical protein IJC11_01990 [Alphaproteobacteria bacterium]|nr:hypothetical protein [Alphaproteobacteria bacterium]MBQ3117076.1 hypothetical protein [Alphaproteobacteria bacterium]MBQ6854909.1 hypothetical protein [Alphaproteobacteria bacterium]
MTQTYHSLNTLCIRYNLSPSDILDGLFSTDMELCIHCKNLKTYFFDFTLINEKTQKYAIKTLYLTGPFYLATYDSCKILHQGTATVSKLKPQNYKFIAPADTQQVSVKDLLFDEINYQKFKAYLSEKQTLKTSFLPEQTLLGF